MDGKMGALNEPQTQALDALQSNVKRLMTLMNPQKTQPK
jgi:hypothetical protein